MYECPSCERQYERPEPTKSRPRPRLCLECYEKRYLAYVDMCIEAGDKIPSELKWERFGARNSTTTTKTIEREEAELVGGLSKRHVVAALKAMFLEKPSFDTMAPYRIALPQSSCVSNDSASEMVAVLDVWPTESDLGPLEDALEPA